VGNPFDGITLYGNHVGQTFKDGDETTDFADRIFQDEDWWVVAIEPSPLDAEDEEGDED
jgi:hypothetical protein